MRLKTTLVLLIMVVYGGLMAQNHALELNAYSPYNDYVLVGNGVFNQVFNGCPGYSFEAWIKPRQLSLGSAKNRIFTSMITGTGASMDVYLTGGGKLHVGGRSASSDLYQTATSSSVVVNPGQWYHIAAVFNFTAGSKSIRGYVNGDLVCSNNNPAFSSPVYYPGVGGVDIIGAHPLTSPQVFDQFYGVIDEYRVWNYSRSQSQIRADMELELDLPQNGLVAYWMFNEGEGGIAFDSSGSGLNSQLVNLPPDCWVEGNMPAPSIYISEPIYNLDTQDFFDVDVMIEGMKEDLRAYEITVSYDPMYLSIESLESISEGSFLSEAGSTQWYATGSSGVYTVTGAIVGGISTAATGSGSLFRIRMKTLDYGTGSTPTQIELSNPILRGILNNDIELESLRNGAVNIDGPVLESQVIPLYTGWNLISSWIVPQDDSMEAVFADLISAGYLVKVQNESGQAFEYDPMNGWYNNIGQFEVSEGYMLNVNTDCSLIITGYIVTLPMTVELIQGWNFIPYPYGSTRSAMEVIQSLIDHGKLVKVQDESGYNIDYDNGNNQWIDNIGVFESGEAYNVSVSEDTQLEFLEVRNTNVTAINRTWASVPITGLLGNNLNERR